MKLWPLLRFASVVLSVFPVAAIAQQPPPHPGLDAPGFHQNRHYFTEMPFENIDTLSGGLVLTFTDLVLPGNAGRELKFQRTYNSKGGAWTFGIVGIPLRISNPPYPTLETPRAQELTPALHMSDGSIRAMAWYGPPNINNQTTFDEAISSDFWRFSRGGVVRKLSIPNGDTCEYGNDSLPNMLRVEACQDPFGNDVTFAWSADPPKLTITQELDDATFRHVILEFATATSPFPTRMIYQGETVRLTTANGSTVSRAT